MYGSPTTTELKKKHSPRPVGELETGSQAERTGSKAAAGGPGWARRRLAEWAVPLSCADKPGGTTGDPDRPHNTGLQHREIKPQSL